MLTARQDAMAAEYDTKAVLLDLARESGNRVCFECQAPSPQWASVSLATYICLACSGVHRSLGVHISFVRSLTMDKWTEVQVKKMRLGGNDKARAFLEAQPSYDKALPIPERYNTHAAALYRDKLDAEANDRAWDPSMTPVPEAAASSSLRKARTTGRSASPASGSAAAQGGPNRPLSPGSAGVGVNPYKAQNETFFASMGERNAARAEGLRPSEGGKYAGFGSAGSYNPAEATSSKALPSFDDVAADPVAALTRGFGFFRSALTQAATHVNESVVQPGLAKATDPNLREQLSAYAAQATTVLSEGARQGGHALSGAMKQGAELAKRDLGVDIGDGGAGFVERIAGTSRGGYAPMGNGRSATSLDRQEAGLGDADFFEAHGAGSSSLAPAAPTPVAQSTLLQPAAGSAPSSGRSTPLGRRKLGATKAAAVDDADSWAKFE